MDSYHLIYGPRLNSYPLPSLDTLINLNNSLKEREDPDLKEKEVEEVAEAAAVEEVASEAEATEVKEDTEEIEEKEEKELKELSQLNKLKLNKNESLLFLTLIFK